VNDGSRAAAARDVMPKPATEMLKAEKPKPTVDMPSKVAELEE
jgi:hypothetical protein